MPVREDVLPAPESTKAKVSGGRQVLTWIALAVVAYIVWLPVSNNEVLYPLLGGMAVASVMLTRRLDKTWVVVGASLLALVLLMWLIGNLRANLFATAHAFTLLPTLIVWLAWAAAQTPWSLRLAFRVVLVAGLVGATGIVLMVGAESGWFPAVLPEQFLLIQGGYVDFAETGIAIRFLGLSALAGVAPLAIAGVMLPQARAIAPRWLFILVAVMSVAAVLLSGRRAIAVIVVLAPALVLLITLLTARSSFAFGRTALITSAGGIAVLLAYRAGNNPVKYAIDDALATFAAGNGLAADEVRVRQRGELLTQFDEHPFLGNGLGKVLDSGFTRSDTRPWMFELQFHMMLMNGGIFVALACLLLVAYVVNRAVAVARDPEAVPYVVLAAAAGAGMLIANWTNPYLIAPGHGWAIALILGVVVAFGNRHT